MTTTAYKAFWVDSVRNQRSSLRAGFPGYYHVEHDDSSPLAEDHPDYDSGRDKDARQPLMYPTTGEWVTAPPGANPYLSAFDTIEHTIEFILFEFGGRIEGDRLLPSPYSLRSQPGGRAWLQGHVEIWGCEVEPLALTELDNSNLKISDWQKDEYVRSGTILCRRIRLLEQVGNLAAYSQRPADRFTPEYLPEPTPKTRMFTVKCLKEESIRAIATLEVEAETYEEACALVHAILQECGPTDSVAEQLGGRWFVEKPELHNITVPGPSRRLHDLEHLPAQAARALANNAMGPLHLSQIRQLSPKAAYTLAASGRPLFLGGFKGLPLEIAKALSSGELSRIWLEVREVSDQAARALRGICNINPEHIEYLTEATAWLLPLHDHLSSLSFSRLKELSAPAAALLAQSSAKELVLWLPHLSPDAAKELARCPGDLWLAGLQELSDKAVEALATHKGGRLKLCVRKKVSDNAALALARHEGPLWFQLHRGYSQAVRQAVLKRREEWKKKACPEPRRML